MRRFRHRSLCGMKLLAIAIALPMISTARVSADEQPSGAGNEAATQLIGAWKLEQAARPGTPSGIGKRLKLFTGTHWCVIQPDDAGKVVFLHGGTYEFDGSSLKTKTDFAGQSTASFIGTAGTVKIKIEGDVLKQTDPNGVYNETWRRVPKPDEK